MAETDNADQIAYWNAEAGETWAALQEQIDAQLEAHGLRAMQALAPAAGERIVDVGCGSGQTSLALGQAVGRSGAVMGLDISRFKRNGVHIHVPSGAIPKDGPSAGVTMATALASSYVGKPVRSDTAMTGEISLAGLVLPVGGIKEKVLAAHRAGIRRIILPKPNEKDLKDVPQEVRDDLTFILAERVEEVLRSAFDHEVAPAAAHA